MIPVSYALSHIYLYPVKSLGGISVPESTVQLRGLQYDRRWMVTDPQGVFRTQREIPQMALLRTAIDCPTCTFSTATVRRMF